MAAGVLRPPRLEFARRHPREPRLAVRVEVVPLEDPARLVGHAENVAIAVWDGRARETDQLMRRRRSEPDALAAERIQSERIG